MTQHRKQPRVLRFVVSSALVTPALMSLGCPSDAPKPTANPGPEPLEEGEEVQPHTNTGPESETPAKTSASPQEVEEEPHSNAGPQEDEEEPHSNAGPQEDEEEPHSNAGPNGE